MTQHALAHGVARIAHGQVSRRPYHAAMRAGNHWTGVGLGVILALAAVLRLWGLGHGLPFIHHPDEHNLAFRALDAAAHGGNPGWFEYPSLTMMLLWPLYAAYYLVSGAESPAAFYQLYKAQPGTFHLLGRGLVAVMGIATVGLLYLLARRVANPGTALLAAALLALAPLHVRDSWFLTVDVPAGFWSVLCLWLLLRGMQQPTSQTWQRLWPAAVACGLAMGTKYTCAMLLVPLLHAAWRGPTRRTALPALFGVAAGVFLLTTPYALLDWRTFATDLAYQGYTSRGHALYGGTTTPWWHYLETCWWGLGPAATVLMLPGLATWVRRRETRTLLLWLAAFLTPLLLVERAWARWLLPLIPVLALLAVMGGQALAQRIPTAWRTLVVATLAALVLLPGLTTSLSMVRLMAGQDTRNQTRDWLLDNLPPDTMVWQTMFGAPLKQQDGFRVTVDTSPVADRAAFAAGLAHRPQAPTLAALQARGHRVFLLSGFATQAEEWPYTRQHLTWFAGYEALYQSIRREGELVYAIHPAPPAPGPIDAEDIYARRRQPWAARYPGPDIEVYVMPDR